MAGADWVLKDEKTKKEFLKYYMIKCEYGNRGYT